MNIPFPLGGVSEDFSLTDQPPNTAQDARNARGLAAKSGRWCGGSRSGTKRYPDSALSSGVKVSHLATVTYDSPNQTYASLGNSLTTEWSAANPVTGDTLGLQCGSQSDVYIIDGPTGIAKLNADGVFLWKIALAADDKSHTVRALLVDASTPDNQGTDFVIAGVSSGGRSTKAKIWGYRQLDDNKTEKTWEMTPGGFTEAIRIYQDKLYLLVNFPEQNRAAVIVYDKYLTEDPTEVLRWGVPYPAHDMDVSPKDAFIFTASDAAVPNASFNRDLNPQCPKATLDYVDWTPEADLANYQQRVWGHWDTTAEDTVSVDPRNLAFPTGGSTATAPPGDSLDGGDVRAWLDKSGKGRHWYQTSDQPTGTGNPAARGAIYRTKGIAGKPSLHFDGVTCGMRSEAPGTADKAFRHEQLCALPSYVGAQFVCFMAVRIAQDNTARALLGWGNTGSSSWNTDARFIAVNSAVTSSATPTVRPGHVYVHEPGGTVSDTSASTPDAGAPGSATVNNLPLGYGLPDSGLAIITWICDGRQHDVFGTATRSQFRINGNPCDRWQSAVFSTLAATTLGYLAGPVTALGAAVFEVGEILVLSDWYDSNDAIQRLINTSGTDTSAKYPDGNWTVAGDSEIERIEGHLAHKWGMAHELIGGKFGKLHFGGQPADGDTVTIGSTVYRYKTTIAATNDIHIGTDAGNSALNFYRAINTQGTSGTDYYFTNTYNADVRANEPIERADASWDVVIRPRNTFAAAISLSETSANLDWAHATTQDATSGSSSDWYPHPFFIDRTTNTPAGPPRVAGATTISNYWRLRSIYPIVAAWDPANGRCRDVLTSNFDGAGTGVGGVGYGVRVASTGEVFSCGPRQATVSALPAIVADATDVRKFTWSNSAFGSLTPSASNDTWTWGASSSPASPGALGYGYPRMAVDRFDNLYLPYFNTTGGTNDSLFGFTKASSGAGLSYSAVLLFDYPSLTDHNEAYAVAVDPLTPKFQPANALNRAEFLVLATRIEAVPTSRSSVWKLRALSTTQTSASPRVVVAVGVSNGDVYSFTSAAKTLIASGGLDSAAGFIDSFQMFGKRVFTDGKSYKIWDPVAGTFKTFTSSGPGVIPPRCRLATTWRQRPVLARPTDNPNQFFFGKQGTIDNFDTQPYTVTSIQALIGSDTPAGMPADVVNAFIAINDDIAYIGGDHSIVMLAGDPMADGRIHLISDTIGIAFGRAYCKAPNGTLFFFSTRGGVYSLAVGGTPQPLSSSQDPYRNKIERRLQAIDQSLYFIRMEWNDIDKGFHLIVCPYGAGGTIVEHYFWEEPGGAWWPDRWLVSTIQPTAICVMDGDLAADRVILLGCEDGYVRKWDKDALGDDVIPSTGLASKYIDSFVRIGPFAGKKVDLEYLYSRMWAVFANGEGAPWVKVYSTDRPDVIGDPVWQGKMQPGRNPWQNIIVRASYLFIDLQLSDPRQRWSFESMGFQEVIPCGIARMA